MSMIITITNGIARRIVSPILGLIISGRTEAMPAISRSTRVIKLIIA